MIIRARKNLGECEACGLDIVKGDEYVICADDEDIMITKRGMKVIPGRDFFRLHSVCSDVIQDNGEVPIDAKEALEETIGDVWEVTLKGKTWADVITIIPEMRDIDKEFKKVIEKWQKFYSERTREVGSDGKSI